MVGQIFLAAAALRVEIMCARPSEKTKMAIALILEEGKTPYAAAKEIGVHLTTLYRSRLYKELCATKRPPKNCSECVESRRRCKQGEDESGASIQIAGMIALLLGIAEHYVADIESGKLSGTENLGPFKSAILEGNALLNRILAASVSMSLDSQNLAPDGASADTC